MTRLGKIARLPHDIREQLNIRLRDGEEGKQLVEWLNGLPEAQAVLAAKFGGRPINAQNLTEWKQGGYEDWLRHQEDSAFARQLTENAEELEKEAGDICLEDRLAASMAIALARLLRQADELSDGADKQKAQLEVARELARLRRESHNAERVRLERERWKTKQVEVIDKKHADAATVAMYTAWFPLLFGNLLPDLARRLPKDVSACLEASGRLRRAQDGQADPKIQAASGIGSNPIKPDQTQSNLHPDKVHALSVA
jgi:hypothetical protein